MCSPRRVLTFAWSDRLVSLLARQGDDWDVVPRTTADREAPWRLARRLPSTAKVTRRSEALGRLGDAEYDLVVCHALPDLDDVSGTDVPVVFVLGGTRALAQTLGLAEILRKRVPDEARSVMFLSDAHGQEWDIEGEVVPVGLDVQDAIPYTGVRPEVLVVGQFADLLPEVVDAPFLARATAGLPVVRVDRTVGQPIDEPHTSGDSLLGAYARCRVFLDTSPSWLRSGQHLAILEAMASGQPVVTVPKPESPIVNGLNGFVESDAGKVHQRLLELLSDRDLAVRLGAAARRTIVERFPHTPFRSRWQRLIETTAGSAVAVA